MYQMLVLRNVDKVYPMDNDIKYELGSTDGEQHQHELVHLDVNVDPLNIS